MRIPSTAYTPLYNASMSHRAYWRVAWCFANQQRIDLTIELTAENEFTVSRCFACHRDIVAWWAIRMGRDLTFQTGEVDIDVAKHVVSRAGATENVHKGRLLVFKERSTAGGEEWQQIGMSRQARRCEKGGCARIRNSRFLPKTYHKMFSNRL